MINNMIRKTVLTAAIAFTLTGAALSHEATKGANGGALIDVDGHHVEFVPSVSAVEPNKLTAPIGTALSSGAKVVVTGTLSDGHNLQGRFQIP